MNTPSHWLITAAVAKGCNGIRLKRAAFLWGSVAPDMPLYLLTLVGWIHLHLLRGWTTGAAFRYMFDVQFFRDPIWIIGHNSLHAPVLLILTGVALGRWQRRWPQLYGWGCWFLIGCLLHTAVDIPVHVEDGPLVLFPLEWTIRFRSWISYWDPRYYGTQFFWLELGLDLGLALYLWAPAVVRWWQLKRGQVLE